MESGATNLKKERFIYTLYNVYLLYMKSKDDYSTMRVSKSTKNILMELDFAKKNMSFEDILLELIKNYKKR